MSNIAIFASGSGTNTEKIISHFKKSKEIFVSAILCNNPNALVIQRAKNHNIEHLVFNRDDFYNTSKVVNFLSENNINFIVLSGFLWLMPKSILDLYPNRIINIHPALLPAHGGKGMYGNNVHEAVIEAGDKFSGITIHHVNEKFDDGNNIFQAKISVEKGETAKSLAQKIHQLEYDHFPTIIENCVKSL